MTPAHPGPDLATYIPPDVDMNVVRSAVAANGVSAPPAVVAGLEQVVADARSEGIDLKVVVIGQNPPIDTPLRDIATEVGRSFPDATVLAMSPSFAGTYSRHYDRVTLEAGQDLAKVPGDPVQSARNFVSELNTPHFPWTDFTVVLVVAVALAAVAARMLTVLARRRPAGTAAVAPAAAAAETAPPNTRG